MIFHTQPMAKMEACISMHVGYSRMALPADTFTVTGDGQAGFDGIRSYKKLGGRNACKSLNECGSQA